MCVFVFQITISSVKSDFIRCWKMPFHLLNDFLMHFCQEFVIYVGFWQGPIPRGFASIRDLGQILLPFEVFAIEKKKWIDFTDWTPSDLSS